MIKKGSFRVGSDTGLVIVNEKREFTVYAERVTSKGKNTPFDGWKLKGKAIMTIVKGKIIWRIK